MAQNTETPAAGDGGRQKAMFRCPAERSEITKNHVDLQQLRAAWLTRRRGISPILAALIANLALGEVRYDR